MNELTNKNIKEMVTLSKQMSRLTRQALENAMTGFPNNHFPVLERLYMTIHEYGTDGSISASQLAQDMCIAPSALSRELRNLEADGVIERRLDPTDRRKTLISITGLGEEQIRVCEGAVIRYFSPIIEIIGEEDLQQLCKIHRKISEALMLRNSEWNRERQMAEGETVNKKDQEKDQSVRS